MMKYDHDAKQMKYEVLKRVSELAFAGKLTEANLDKIPHEIITGSVPHFRCCVYKERAIIRERVRLATGKSLSTNPDNEIVTVMPAACEGCPIGHFTVTTNCQKCMAKKCVAACPFGAISISGNGAYIDQSKCKECGRCAAACPYHAIADTLRPCVRACPVKALVINDETKRAEIEYDKCINCGACVANCPFGAISDSSSIPQIVSHILDENTEIFAMFAPAVEGQFGKANVGMIKSAIRKLGFTDVYEVSIGADSVSEHEAEDVLEAYHQGRKMTTSCCPAFVEMIRKHFPKLVEYMSPTVSPMVATVKYLKLTHPDAKFVFIGPCIAKKHEIRVVEDSADYVLTVEELVAMFDAKGVCPETEEAENEQDGSVYGKGFAQSGGVSACVMRVLAEKGQDIDLKVLKCNGAAECKKALTILNAGKLPEDFIEGMSCIGGCIAGPGSILPTNAIIKNRMALLKEADNRDITANNQTHDYDQLNMNREDK